MAIMPMTEFDRFMRLFDRMFDFVETYIHKTPNDKYEWIPLDGPGVSFGDRLENITIKGLYVHLTTSEDGFVRSLLSNGARNTRKLHGNVKGNVTRRPNEDGMVPGR